jgi:hypothetical protein
MRLRLTAGEWHLLGAPGFVVVGWNLVVVQRGSTLSYIALQTTNYFELF